MKIVVIGAGVVGLSAAYELATRGHDVDLLDRFGVGNHVGSSAGRTRTYRGSYTNPDSVALVLEARRRWEELERASGRSLLQPRHQLTVGDKAAPSSAALTAMGVPNELGRWADVADRFPELRFADDVAVLAHEEAAVMLANQCLLALASGVTAAGGKISAPELVLRLEDDGTQVRVRTEHRTLDADTAVVCAGPWAQELLDPISVRLPLGPGLAQVLFLAAPALDGRPCTSTKVPGIPNMYGHGVPGIGYKLGFDFAGDPVWNPEARGWTPDRDEVDRLRAWMSEHAPGLAELPEAAVEAHPWTMTPDGDPVLDVVGGIAYFAGCSGHCFKLAPALGAALADLAEGTTSSLPIAQFRRDREAIAGAAVDGLATRAITS